MAVIAFQFCLRPTPCINSILFTSIREPTAEFFLSPLRSTRGRYYLFLSVDFAPLFFLLFVTRLSLTHTRARTQSKFSSLSQELTWLAVWLKIRRDLPLPAILWIPWPVTHSLILAFQPANSPSLPPPSYSLTPSGALSFSLAPLPRKVHLPLISRTNLDHLARNLSAHALSTESQHAFRLSHTRARFHAFSHTTCALMRFAW
jgi:hypothetical protein